MAFIIPSSSVYFTNGIEKTVYIPFEEDSTMASEFVSLAVVRELLETQERTFKQFIEFHKNSVKEVIKALRKYVDDIKTSLVFSLKDIDHVKEKCYKAEERLMGAEDSLTEANSCIDEQEPLENHSCRNNVKIMGIPENENRNETWEESEQKAIKAIRKGSKLPKNKNLSQLTELGNHAPLTAILAGKSQEQAQADHREILRVAKERKGRYHCQKDEARRSNVL